jgi:hypothetical protein
MARAAGGRQRNTTSELIVDYSPMPSQPAELIIGRSRRYSLGPASFATSKNRLPNLFISHISSRSGIWWRGACDRVSWKLPEPITALSHCHRRAGTTVKSHIPDATSASMRDRVAVTQNLGAGVGTPPTSCTTTGS